MTTRFSFPGRAEKHEVHTCNVIVILTAVMFVLPLNHYNFCSPHDKTPKVGLKRLELIAQRIHCLLYGPDFLQPQ